MSGDESDFELEALLDTEEKVDLFLVSSPSFLKKRKTLFTQ